MKKALVLGLSLLTLGTIVLPSTFSSVAYADELNRPDLSIEQNELQAEPIYSDEEGNVFTSTEIIVQKGSTDPRVQLRSISASPIVIGIKWGYQNKTDATKLLNTFRNVAATEGTLTAINTILAGAGIVTGGIAGALAALNEVLGVGVTISFSKAADEISNHLSKGFIYQYADHSTYKTS